MHLMLLVVVRKRKSKRVDSSNFTSISAWHPGFYFCSSQCFWYCSWFRLWDYFLIHFPLTLCFFLKCSWCNDQNRRWRDKIWNTEQSLTLLYLASFQIHVHTNGFNLAPACVLMIFKRLGNEKIQEKNETGFAI